MQKWVCSGYMLSICYVHAMCGVCNPQPNVLNVADGMSLREVRRDLGGHTDGPGMYLPLWATVIHDAPGPDRKCCSVKLVFRSWQGENNNIMCACSPAAAMCCFFAPDWICSSVWNASPNHDTCMPLTR